MKKIPVQSLSAGEYLRRVVWAIMITIPSNYETAQAVQQ